MNAVHCWQCDSPEVDPDHNPGWVMRPEDEVPWRCLFGESRDLPVTPIGTRLVLMSDELFQELGADRIDWGEPNAFGWYTPTLYKDKP